MFSRLTAFCCTLAGLALTMAGGAAPADEVKPEVKPAAKAKPAAKKKSLPLEPDRSVEFTVSEGTWLSLDVSPDAKTLMLELLGDLYTLPIEGGEAKPLSTGMSFDSQPRYSPDGSLIAFLSDREGSENLWTMKADGSEPKQLSRDQRSRFISPSWTPDGEYVVVSRSQPSAGAYELWMYHVKGGSGVQITKAQPQPNTPRERRHNAAGAVASPDGRYFYYARRLGSGPPYNATLPMWQIARRDRTTGDEDILTNAGGSAMRPALSPDGARLVYGTRYDTQTGLRLRDLATGDDRWLKYPVQRDDQESLYTRDLLPGYAFLPGGREIVLSFGGKIHRLDVESGQSRPIPFTAKVSQQLGPKLNFPARIDEGPVRARLAQAPVQSPDGKRLAFSSLTRLHLMDLPGGTPQRATAADAREFQPSWSPDGQWLAYVTWSPEGGHIWKLAAGGQGAPQQLTRVPAFYRDPVWSPDGSQIVALRASKRQRLETGGFGGTTGLDLVAISAAGGDARLIIPARGAGRPHFTRDPGRVYLYTQQGLLSLRLDGTDRRTHVRITSRSTTPEPSPASDVRMSPDGRFALALVRNQLYLATVPRVGGDAPTINVDTPSTPVKKLTEVGADSFAWADDGATITWALGASFFRQALSTVTFDPAPARDRGGESPNRDREGAEPEPADEPKPTTPAKSLAQEIEIRVEKARHTPEGVAALRNARVITMRGDEVITSGDVLVTGNRITAVGARGSVTIPPGARQFDLKGMTIMPGIVDVHAHWTEIRRDVLDLQAWPFLANLAYGVTTGRDPQTGSNDTFAYQDLIDAGEMPGPRAFSTGPGVFSSSDFQSLEDARRAVAKYKQYYKTNTLKSYAVGNRRQRQWMVQACKEHGIMPTTEGALDLKLDLTHVVDGFSGNEHSFPIVPLYEDVAQLVARAGLFYTPTLLVAYGGPWAENHFYETTEVHDDPKLRRFIPHHVLDSRTRRRPWFRPDEHVYPKLAAGAAKIIRAGGRVGVGGHGQLQGIQCHWELWALASGGLTGLEALRAATLHGAEAIGYAQDLGSLEPGKLADLVVLAKDPLQDIRNTNSIRYVMKNGELFEGDTLNQVWPREKPLPPLWWWDDKP